MRQQRISRKKTENKLKIVDERSKEIPIQNIDPKTANLPVRTVNFVEVGGMSPAQIRILLEQLNHSHQTAQGGIHYVVPVRNGKIGSDILFEKEWLDIVNKTCEIIDNKIVLRDGAQEVMVIRQSV